MAGLLPQIANPYLASLVLGVLYGMTTCTAACLPYLGSYIAAVGAGFRRGLTISATYSSGRILAYGLLASFVALIRGFLTGSFLTYFQKYGSIVSGAVIVVVGLNILLRRKSSVCNCKTKSPENIKPSNGFKQFFDRNAFFLGFTRSLLVCPPLIAILLYAMASFSGFGTVAITVLFGLGTALSPLLLFGGTLGWLLNKSPNYSNWISKIAGAILILLAIQLFFCAVTT
jgi:sulfite exporter TauE/SafE